MKSKVISHIGKRETNQDRILAEKIGTDSYLYIVADGMGGYDNGDIAAEMIIDSLTTFLSNSDQFNVNVIQKAINKANLALRQYQEQHQSKLGSTLGGILISKKTAKTFWVGDVKILHYSKGKLCFESKSHNLSSELSETDNSNGRVNLSKYNHLVTRSIQGDVKKSLPSYQELLLNKEDKLFICSDGVHNIIDSHTLQFLFNNEDSTDSLIDTIEQRLQKEANDNASLILIEGFD
ncbi:protein phosphatase 2C-related protein [Zunongwangia profunda SM-A87]|jgi:protein phosphatase|uniref:Protein phosphatase 2C-related protein n=1 Tax=Zunongwangia profunda (strain DSM 18752 / CCTCC AB 206139 / SM-A87) TaxID=655815 RepID=D5BAA6_ZUNPS|nr:PP2C family serine/threonine-protein phosphatase [Zunongwangia profunda]ADF54432.1 protein phosphatase 2C-related protein [Zunongwangia profunda SM-A87]